MNFSLETMQILDRSPRSKKFSDQDHAIVRQAILTTLDGREKCVVLLRFWEGNTVSEISEILDIPWTEVLVYLNRAMTKLKSACVRNPEFSRAKPEAPKPSCPSKPMKKAA